MKILFITEFFSPFTFGGAEVSTHYLAKELSKQNEIYVLTPNYGADRFEKDGNLRLFRFPFYKKLKAKERFPSSIHYTNPFWIFYVAFKIYQVSKKYNVDCIHVHGKYSIPSVRIANVFLKRKVLATIRDYQVICNYGFCIYKKDKSCDIKDYFLYDFKQYWNTYIENKSPITFIINVFYAFYGRLARNLIKSFALGLSTVVLSESQRKIFVKNGFKRVSVIGNSIEFPISEPKNKLTNSVLYAGRLTSGKGVDILINIIPKFFENYPKYKFFFIGEGTLKKKLIYMASKYTNLIVLGSISHNKLLEYYKRSKLVVVPSVWPEPFGRVALESLAKGTPVVATNVGGLVEIVKDNKYGYITKPKENEIFDSICMALKNNSVLMSNIRKDYVFLKYKFGKNISEKYLEMYKNL